MPKTQSALFLLWCLVGWLVACDLRKGSSLTEHHLKGETMGTNWQAIIVAAAPPPISLIQNRLNQIEAIFSTWRIDSDISRFNQQRTTEWQSVPEEFARVAHHASQMAAITQGAYDPTIAPILKLWGFGPGTADDSTSLKIAPTAEAIQVAKQHVNYRLVEIRLNPPALRKLDPQIELDLSALIEGFALDELAKWFESASYHDFLLEIGGEMIARGVKADRSPWKVGIHLPSNDSSKLASTVHLHHEAISTSGSYRQNWLDAEGRSYSHILDARTGFPVQHSLKSVSVLAPTALEADIWATALMILGPKEGKFLAQQHQIQAFFQQNSK